MSHRNALATSIGLTVILALGIFTARARLFEVAPAGEIAPAATAIVESSLDQAGTGEVTTAAEPEQSIGNWGDSEEAEHAEDDRSVTSGNRQEGEDHEDGEHDDD